MFCPKCGAPNEDTNRFCQNCSQPLAGDFSKKTARRKSPLKIALGVIALLVILFVLYAALSPDNPPSSATGSEPAVESNPTVASSSPGDAVSADSSPSAEDGSAADAAVPAESSTTAGESDAASAAPAEPTVIEVGDILTKDIFDWHAASEKDKEHMAFACQMYWHAGGITGPAVDDSSSEVSKKISENLGEQGNVFQTACEAYGIDPTPWTSTTN